VGNRPRNRTGCIIFLEGNGMTKHKEIYIWWISCLLLFAGFFWATYAGLTQHVYSHDFSHMTTFIFFILLSNVAYLGYLSYLIDQGKTATNVLLKKAGHIRFFSGWVMGAGILGTVLGLIHMTSGSPPSGGPEGIMAFMSTAWPAMAIAFYPNALAVFTSLFLRVLSHYILFDVEEDEEA
jgi:hypothetical protein